ncbi:DMT family transporter [Falsirhodobacter sp. 20TX0035]|uniref:DMT family transporter n=1 Tax=Falsirhodobacter sp. 20TX0035 TaxID=3022019 RepID=UPI00232FB16A|nr:DMT family transporter [Falsirhodobacter sp. 20TX0035]MDB6455141.1 DMT family transporter [Falsirhodobacter sp. 20TX0035]
MIDWLNSIAGTPTGSHVGMALALCSAFAHACFGALQKGKADPWISRAGIDLWIVIYTLPVALFLVPWPQGSEWLILAGAVVIHLIYKICMARAYERGAYTVVYPVVRGTGPLVTLTFAALFLGEHYVGIQWFGVAVLSGSILWLAKLNLDAAPLNRPALVAALGWALVTGITVAVYTTYDAWSIRLWENPFAFLVWFFLVTSVDFPSWMVVRRRGLAWARPVLWRGAIGALVAFVSFGGVMLGTRIGKVAEVSSLRETSTLFAALIGWVALGEKSSPSRLALMGGIAAGAVLVQLG